MPGPLPAGQWEVVVGKAKVNELPAHYAVQITLRTAPTLDAQSERRPYAPPTPLATGARWYAGDFHVHSRESGDAHPTIDEVLDFAAGRGLDFVMLSEHNTTSQLTWYDAEQRAHPNVLLLPGAEFTTYAGHANIIGTTQWVDHRIGVRGATIAAAIANVHGQGGLFSINHPLLDVGDLCIGCGWHHPIDPAEIDGVEVQTGILPGLSYWESLVAQGSHAAAMGGSDDHRAGQNLGPLDSPIGSPTTMVYADELSVDAIVRGVRDARTVVKLTGPQAPMIDSELSGRRAGDTVFAQTATLHATVTAGNGMTLRVIKNGSVVDQVSVQGDPFTHDFQTEAPPTGEDRYRLEVADTPTHLQTVTSYVWLQRAPDDTPTTTPTPTPVASATATTSATPTASATPIPCIGDCDGNRRVDIDDLIIGVRIALAAAPIGTCMPLDRDDSGAVEVDELIAAVKASLDGCD